jgi:DNA-binding response OmpR family regulator
MEPLIVLAEYEEPGQLAGPLVQQGYHIETFDSADAALRFCGINNVSLVITRALFPYGITGVELISRLQSLANQPRAIMVTGHRSDKLGKIPGYPPPGVSLLHKPIVNDELLKTVNALVPA